VMTAHVGEQTWRSRMPYWWCNILQAVLRVVCVVGEGKGGCGGCCFVCASVSRSENKSQLCSLCHHPQIGCYGVQTL